MMEEKLHILTRRSRISCIGCGAIEFYEETPLPKENHPSDLSALVHCAPTVDSLHDSNLALLTSILIQTGMCSSDRLQKHPLSHFTSQTSYTYSEQPLVHYWPSTSGK